MAFLFASAIMRLYFVEEFVMTEQLLIWIQQPLFWVLTLLGVAVYLFIRNQIRMDMVALLVMLVFCLSGIQLAVVFHMAYRSL